MQTNKRNASQYTRPENISENIVDAIYIKSPLFPDNPLIEALPLPRSFNDMLEDFHSPHQISALTSASEFERKQAAYQAGLAFQVILPFYPLLEETIYNALVSSYSKRRFSISPEASILYQAEGQTLATDRVLQIPVNPRGTVSGGSLLGNSDSGKSYALGYILEHLPRAIRHTFSNGNTFVQIPWIRVNVKGGSNFSAIFVECASQIDRALGNVTPVYRKEMEKKRSLGDKGQFLVQLIECFAVGIIILDEIQDINIAHSRANSLQTLIGIANDTNAALFVAGLKSGKERLFSEDYLVKRMSPVIDADNYCLTYNNAWSGVINLLFETQYTFQPLVLTEKLRKLLFQCSQGRIGWLVAIYIQVQITLIQQENRKNSESPENIIRDAAQTVRGTFKP